MNLINLVLGITLIHTSTKPDNSVSSTIAIKIFPLTSHSLALHTSFGNKTKTIISHFQRIHPRSLLLLLYAIAPIKDPPRSSSMATYAAAHTCVRRRLLYSSPRIIAIDYYYISARRPGESQGSMSREIHRVTDALSYSCLYLVGIPAPQASAKINYSRVGTWALHGEGRRTARQQALGCRGREDATGSFVFCYERG